MKRLLTCRLLFCASLFLAGCVSAEPSPIQPSMVVPTKIIQETGTTAGILPADGVAGIVVDEKGTPVENAIVRLQATSLTAITNSQGQFRLKGIQKKSAFRITAFSPGYFIKEAEATLGTPDITITLVKHAVEDNAAYTFLTAGSVAGTGGENTGCAKCHSAVAEEAAKGITLPFDQWLLDAHSKSAQNPRFLSMYNGTDLQGHQSPLTTYTVQKDYGQVPLRPTLDELYYGPGFRLDFPGKAGNCASCHAPVAAINAAYDTDPNTVTGTGLEGINCDFCHKIWGVVPADETKLPPNNMPGVLSLVFRRPSAEHQLFIGPFDDVAPGEDTYSPLQNKSDYCAACHSASFWDVKIYNSYGEWLASPYSDPNNPQFKTCQDCHMPPLGVDHFAQIEKGGLTRNSDTIFSHRMPGAADEKLLKNTAQLEVTVKRDKGLMTVSVSVFNANAGHDIPTDSPLRQLLLSVKAFDRDGNPLPLVTGPLLPDWTGDYKNTPGIYFAKILEELWTEVSPTAAYWMQTRILEDTRLPALGTQKAEFVFKSADDSIAKISAALIYRRAFFELMKQKGWNNPDILMEDETIDLP